MKSSNPGWPSKQLLKELLLVLKVFMYTKSKTIRSDDLCLQVFTNSNTVRLMRCYVKPDTISVQLWEYDREVLKPHVFEIFARNTVVEGMRSSNLKCPFLVFWCFFLFCEKPQPRQIQRFHLKLEHIDFPFKLQEDVFPSFYIMFRSDV